MTDQRRPASHQNISGGGTVHLVDIYAQNAVRGIIQNARLAVSAERGRFALPSEFMDRLVVDCGNWILDIGPAEAERAVRGRINDFLDERESLRNRENERRVHQSLNTAGRPP